MMVKNKSIFNIEVIKEQLEKSGDCASWFFTYKGEVYGSCANGMEIVDPVILERIFKTLSFQAVDSLVAIQKKEKDGKKNKKQ